MPRQEDYDYPKAKSLLDEYVQPEECATGDLPTAIKPELVSRYIREEVKPDFDLDKMTPAMEVLRFYGLREHAERVLSFIKGGERDVLELRRSCVIIAAVCELGAPDQQKAAVGHFDRLLAGELAEKDDALEYLINTFFDLPPRTPQKPIQERVQRLRERTERQGPENQLGRYLEYHLRLLPWVLAEKGRKDWLLTMPPGPERIRRWAEAYLMFEMETPFKWDRAAAFGLLRLAREEGDRSAVEALQGAMRRTDPQKDDPEAVAFRKTRGYKARGYFLEVFDGDTRGDVKASARPQDDLIH